MCASGTNLSGQGREGGFRTAGGRGTIEKDGGKGRGLLKGGTIEKESRKDRDYEGEGQLRRRVGRTGTGTVKGEGMSKSRRHRDSWEGIGPRHES